MHLSYFIRQKSYERVVYTLRRHWLTFVPHIGLFILLVAVPPVVYALIQTLFPNLLSGPLIYPLSVLTASVYYLFILLFFYSQFVDFYLDLWVVTNDRIIDIEQHGLFNRTITELDLFRIQDVTSDVRGFFQTIFHFGDLSITTASANANIVFRQVPRPERIRQELIRLADEDRRYHLSDLKEES